MAGAVVVMPGVVVLVKNNPSVFVHIRRDLVQCGFQIMFYNPRLKLQGGQPGNPPVVKPVMTPLLMRNFSQASSTPC